MRLKAVAPVMYLEANEDTAVGGVHVAGGTAIALLPRVAAVDDRYFSAAREFRPERWLADADPRYVVHDPRAFVPFGAGARFCPGRNLALLEIKTAISMLVRNFGLVRTRNAPPVGERFAFTMMPTGLCVNLAARNGV